MNTYYMGMDVSKGYSDFVVLDQQENSIIKPFKLDDTRENHDELIKLVRKISVQPDTQLLCGVESTGGYENNWYNTLLKESEKSNLKITRINPQGIFHNKKAGRKKTSTDKISAEHIAKYMRNHSDILIFNQQDDYVTKRKVYKYYLSITDYSAKLKNQLQQNIYISFPELVKFTTKGISDWFLHFLVKYPTLSSLVGVKKDDVTSNIPYIKKEQVDYIFEALERSVSSVDDFFIGLTIKKIASKILEINKEKKEIIKFLNENLDKELIHLLKTIPGCGEESAVAILLMIGDITRFDDAKKMCSFFGLAPVFSQSGDTTSGKHISKSGNKIMRRVLFMVAKSAIKNPYFEKLYSFYKSKNQNYYFAVTCIMHKILRIIFGMMKNKKAFDENIDINYRSRLIQNKKNDDNEKTYVGMSIDAPVSIRERYKRKQEQPQKLNNFSTGSCSRLSSSIENIDEQRVKSQLC